MRRWGTLFVSAIVFLLSGCSRQQEQNKELVHYTQTNALKEQTALEFIEVPVPEHFGVSSWTVCDETVYYAINYMDYLSDHEGKGAVQPTQEHASRILSYDTKSGETSILYQAEGVIEMSDVCADGEILVWEEYPRLENMPWCIKMLSLTDRESKAETIFSDSDTDGELWSIVLSLTEEKIYWYDQSDTEKFVHPISLYQYDLKSGEIMVDKQKIDLSSPYEQVSVIDRQMCTYRMDSVVDSIDAKTSEIYIDDIQTGEQITVSVSTKVMRPVANEDYCIWGESYESNDVLWVYDRQTKQSACVSLAELGGKFSYTLLEDWIIISTHRGLWCLEPETQTYTNLLMFGEKNNYGYLWHNLDGSVAMETAYSDKEFCIVNIKKAG